MKIVTGSEMAGIDRTAIHAYGISGLQLMETAGRGAFKSLLRRFAPKKNDRVVVLCGKGNNGGDGFVVARYLAEAGYSPEVFLVGSPESLKGEALENYRRYIDSGRTIVSLEEGDLSALDRVLQQAKIVVDALLGTGIKGAVRSPYDEIIEKINAACVSVMAIDIPSGLNADDGTIAGACVRADLTVTMGLPKYGLLVSPGIDFVGALDVISLEYPEELTRSDGENPEFFTSEEAARVFPVRSVSTHKGTSGSLLIIAGSTGMTGAAALVGESAVYSGAGLVTVATAASLNPVLEVKLTETMTLPLPEKDGALTLGAYDALREKASQATVLAMGPGLGRRPETGQLVAKILETEVPIVLDADGIYPFRSGDRLLKERKESTVLTPHPGELARFLDTTVEEVQQNRIENAKRAAENNGIIIVLKGPRTVVVDPEGHVSLNSTGNPAMASGGMGDVLTGIIGALIAQGVAAFEAARLGVLIHGLAGDRLVSRFGMHALAATQLMGEIQGACAELIRKKTGGYN